MAVIGNLMHLAWLVVNHIGTLPSAQLGEDPHPEAGGNLEHDQGSVR